MMMCVQLWGGAGLEQLEVPAVRGVVAGDLVPSDKGVSLAQNAKDACWPMHSYRYKRLELAQLLGQLGVFLTPAAGGELRPW